MRSTTHTTVSEAQTSPPRPVDWEQTRADFPALQQSVHGRPLAYLDNAATTQKPRLVLDAIRRFYEADCANIHRGVHTLSERATEAYNASVGTLESRVLVSARRFKEMGATGQAEIPPVQQIERLPRSVQIEESPVEELPEPENGGSGRRTLFD